MDVIGDLGNPQKDAQVVVSTILPAVEASLINKIIPELRAQLTEALDGLTITITVSRKGAS